MKVFDIETLGVFPLEKEKNTEERVIKSNKIIAISLLDIDSDIPISFYGEDEKEILEQFWNAIKNEKTLVGFNCISFDISFILVRSLLNGVKISENFKNLKIVDLRKIIYPYNDFGVGGLRDFCDYLSIPYTSKNGSEMLELYKNKDWEEIKKHSEEDVKITKALYQKCIECNMIKEEN